MLCSIFGSRSLFLSLHINLPPLPIPPHQPECPPSAPFCVPTCLPQKSPCAGQCRPHASASRCLWFRPKLLIRTYLGNIYPQQDLQIWKNHGGKNHAWKALPASIGNPELNGQKADSICGSFLWCALCIFRKHYIQMHTYDDDCLVLTTLPLSFSQASSGCTGLVWPWDRWVKESDENKDSNKTTTTTTVLMKVMLVIIS